MMCPYCGEYVLDGDLICPHCGASLLPFVDEYFGFDDER